MKRQELKNRLIEYAREKELDFPQAERDAKVVADKINEDNINKIISELESTSQ